MTDEVLIVKSFFILASRGRLKAVGKSLLSRKKAIELLRKTEVILVTIQFPKVSASVNIITGSFFVPDKSVYE